MMRLSACGFALALFALASAAPAQDWDGMLNRLGDSLGRNVENRLSGASDKAVDSAFDGAEGAVKCAAGDPDCVQAPADEAGKGKAAGANAKCVATDVGCLKTAKAQGMTVQIVEEEELDVLRCSSTDGACLKRAKQLGKPVEITD